MPKFNPGYAFFLIGIAVATSCQTASSNKEEGADSLRQDTVHAAIDQGTSPVVAEVQDSGPSISNGIVLDNEVTLYADSIGDAEGSERIDAMPVQILGKTGLPVPGSGDGDECSAYYRYQIETPSGRTGWIDGSDLYRVGSGMAEPWGEYVNLLGQEFTFEGKRYFFEGAVEMNMDLTGDAAMYCPTVMLIYFYDDEGVIYKVGFNRAVYPNAPGFVDNDRNGNLEMTITSDGGSAKMESVVKSSYEEKEVIVCDINHSYQDGGQSSALYIAKDGEQFTVVSYEFKTEQ